MPIMPSFVGYFLGFCVLIKKAVTIWLLPFVMFVMWSAIALHFL